MRLKFRRILKCKCILFLAEILWNNLFQNAIKHNIDNGTIKVVLTNDTLTISNTGKTLSVNPDQLFESLSLSGSFNLYQSNNDGEYEGISYSSEAESFTSRLRWRFLESWNFQSNIFYRGARQTTQGQESGDAYPGAGI